MSYDLEINRSEDLTDDPELGRIDFELIVRAAIEATLADRGVEDAAVSVTLVGDEQIANLNQQYLQHDGPTDVISFPLYQGGERPVGDIYIGAQQAQRQAQEIGVPLQHEIARLTIHGTLHVLGFDHPEDESREESEMWMLQERIFATLELP